MPTDDFEKRIADTLDNIQASNSIHPGNKQLITDYKCDKILEVLARTGPKLFISGKTRSRRLSLVRS